MSDSSGGFGQPLLVLNPSHDLDFRRHAHDLMALEGFSSPESLQRALRDAYPRASVRPRDLSNEAVRTWYVYREGRWVKGRD